MPKKISRQVIVITGASSGIGLATAQAAARMGAKVVLAARNETDLNRAADEIRRNGGEALVVVTDVTKSEEVEELARRAVEAFGRIDTWVNNAGASVYGTFKEVPPEDFRRVVDVVFHGQVHGARAALPHLEKTDGALICVGSALSDRGVPLQSAYCAAKHALKGWTDSLRTELRHAGSKVRVTLVKPSSIDTPLFNKARTYMGVQPMPIPPIYEPELAAEGILRAAEGNEREVYIGGAGKALALAERISPALLDVQQKRSGFRKQQTSWPKSADAPTNLYTPVAYDGGLRGDFMSRSKDGSVYQYVAARSSAYALAAAAALAFTATLAGRREDGSTSLLLGFGAAMLTGKVLVRARGS